MSLLDIAEAHAALRRSISVPEWKDAQGVVPVLYWKSLTPAENMVVMNATKAKEESSTDGSIRLIIAKLEDENGKKIFGIEDMLRIKNNVSHLVLNRIGNAILSEETPEEAVKN